MAGYKQIEASPYLVRFMYKGYDTPRGFDVVYCKGCGLVERIKLRPIVKETMMRNYKFNAIAKSYYLPQRDAVILGGAVVVDKHGGKPGVGIGELGISSYLIYKAKVIARMVKCYCRIL